MQFAGRLKDRHTDRREEGGQMQMQMQKQC